MQAAEAERLLKQGAIELYHLQLEAATNSFQQALDLYCQLEMDNCQALVLAVLGKIYFDLEQYDLAIGYHQQALHIYRTLEDAEGEAAMLSNLGNTYAHLERCD
jgi:tetratricopeptide (TPR) repeat protein